MDHIDTSLAELLRQADASSPAVASAPLDATQLLAEVARRRRARRTSQSIAAASLLVAAAVGISWWPASDAPMAKSETGSETAVPSLAELSAAIDAIEAKTEQLENQLASSPAPQYDLLAAIQRSEDEPRPGLEALRTELAELEAREATSDAQLAWDRQWSRSGALRLELARQEARIDPQRAASAYRQIAKSYAGTTWGDEARLALTEISLP